MIIPVVQSKPEPRIVGGSQAQPGDFPYFVEMAGCGGALIAPDAVLFAAHCGNFTGRQIIVGSFQKGTLNYEAKMRYCDEWKEHPKWSENGENEINNDFAICKLDNPVTINEEFVKLEWDEPSAVLAEGDELIVMGHGALAFGAGGSEFVNSVTVPYVPNEKCNERSWYNGLVTDQMLCAGFEDGGKDACQGDSGGPLVKREIQEDGSYIDYHVGVVSWGEGCAFPNKPGVYARTSEAKAFIEQTLCDFNSVSSDCHMSPTPPPPCAATLDVVVETDIFGHETSWSVKEQGSDDEIFSRQYLLPYHVNEHEVCLDKNTCYTFTITDKYGDGMCFNGDCGYYELRTPGEQPFHTGAEFDSMETTEFCVDGDGKKVDELPQTFAPTFAPTPSPTFAPTPSPTHQPAPGIECKDVVGWRRRKKTCKGARQGRENRRKRFCESSAGRNKQVSDFCLESCGKVGVGPCGHLSGVPKNGKARRRGGRSRTRA